MDDEGARLPLARDDEDVGREQPSLDVVGLTEEGDRPVSTGQIGDPFLAGADDPPLLGSRRRAARSDELAEAFLRGDPAEPDGQRARRVEAVLRTVAGVTDRAGGLGATLTAAVWLVCSYTVRQTGSAAARTIAYAIRFVPIGFFLTLGLMSLRNGGPLDTGWAWASILLGVVQTLAPTLGRR